MPNEFSRAELLLGREGMRKLKEARVAVFGLGGVGSFAAEALARSGVGAVDLIDDDRVCLSNLNRQLIALHSTLGEQKVTVMKRRILDINPDCRVTGFPFFYGAETAGGFGLAQYSYLVDAIDTVSSKLELILRADRAGVPIISCMGTGNKLDPTRLEVADLYDTSVCPLARVMRKELRARGIRALKVVYSKEEPMTPRETEEPAGVSGPGCPPEAGESGPVRRPVPGSVAFVPPVAGFILAAEVVKDLVFGRV